MEAPPYVDLFAPRSARDAYYAYVSGLDLERALQALAGARDLLHPPGAWQPRSFGAVDAFGLSGPYNRSLLAAVYGARAARVARGPRSQDGRVAESWTLISPYPSIDLNHLEPGTLLLILRVPPL